MKENRLKISIKKPIEEVFAFTTDPAKTPIWVTHFAHEETDAWPPVVGTTYKNRTITGIWSECTVVAIQPPSFFELRSKDRMYHVQYTYTAYENETEMEYFEWVDMGELEGAFEQKILAHLKQVMETS